MATENIGSKNINTMLKNLKIPCPTELEVNKYIDIWNNTENLYKPEKALMKLFNHYRMNTDIEDVLIKIYALNDAYGTSIFWPIDVAKNILDMEIDDCLSKEGISVIEKIAKKNGEEKFEFQGKNGETI